MEHLDAILAALAFYRRLCVVLTAVMRKLLVLANTLISQDRLWQPKPPIHA